jgi:DNA-binding MarR family transcriptional regulator
MALDIKEHERAKERYLLTLLEHTEAEEKSRSANIPSLEEREIAERSGLDHATVDRISQELEAEGLITCLGGMGQYRVIYSLSATGRAAVEKNRYDSSLLGKRREITLAAKDSAKDAVKSGFGKLLSLAAAGAVAAIAGLWKWDVIAAWLRRFGRG